MAGGRWAVGIVRRGGAAVGVCKKKSLGFGSAVGVRMKKKKILGV